MANKFRQGENEFRRRLMCSVVSDHQVHGLLIDILIFRFFLFSAHAIMMMSAIKISIIEIMILVWKVRERLLVWWRVYCFYLLGKFHKKNSTHVRAMRKKILNSFSSADWGKIYM